MDRMAELPQIVLNKEMDLLSSLWTKSRDREKKEASARALLVRLEKKLETLENRLEILDAKLLQEGR